MISNFRNRPVFPNCSVNPRLDVCASVFPFFITYYRVGREELIELIGLPGIVCVEEGRNDWRQFWFHGVLHVIFFEGVACSPCDLCVTIELADAHVKA
jgi:hypothetical protein